MFCEKVLYFVAKLVGWAGRSESKYYSSWPLSVIKVYTNLPTVIDDHGNSYLISL